MGIKINNSSKQPSSTTKQNLNQAKQLSNNLEINFHFHSCYQTEVFDKIEK